MPRRPADLEHPVLAGVDPETRRALIAAGTLRTCRAGERILEEDGTELSFFLLAAGSVRVFYASPEGLEVVVKIFHAPAAFGEMECLSDIPYLETVEVLERSTILEVPRGPFLDALDRSPPFARNLLRDLAARLCIAAQNERALAFHSVEMRLANLLLTYAGVYGVPAPSGTKIRIPLTQEDLANALGVARRSVTRALRTWSEEAVVTKEGAHFVVRDGERLARAADPSLLAIAYKSGEPLRPRRR